MRCTDFQGTGGFSPLSSTSFRNNRDNDHRLEEDGAFQTMGTEYFFIFNVNVKCRMYRSDSWDVTRRQVSLMFETRLYLVLMHSLATINLKFADEKDT